ncbi:CGNR zinc finger domain-containing protein [Actinoplanes sp. HUAS TT8]|uniref:CGNR zinc finger domain-containing protein n=1 Tax=Actinoplanes sp. HUAS TT8 TaxID=3447453 RepID=UPI003F51F1AC
MEDYCAASDLIVSFVNEPPAFPAGSDVAAATELRASLVTLLRAHSGCTLDPGDVPAAEAHLRQVAVRYPLVPVIGVDTCTFEPVHDGAFGLFARVLAAVADLSYREIWGRVKVCKNEGCHRGFFDKTRNTSALHCSPACSSQASMRAYRNRQKAS